MSIKKNIFRLCSFLLTVTLFMPIARAEIIAMGPCGSSGHELDAKYTLDDKGVLTISGHGEVYSLWGDYIASQIKEVVINEGITALLNTSTVRVVSGSNGLFGCCEKISRISISDSVTKIGNSTFSGCTGLTSVIIPKNVTHIGQYAFSGCTGLTSVIIPESVTHIEQSAFDGCTGLTSVIIPESVTHIEKYAFYGCRNLESVQINRILLGTLSDIFSSCPKLRSIHMDVQQSSEEVTDTATVK